MQNDLSFGVGAGSNLYDRRRYQWSVADFCSVVMPGFRTSQKCQRPCAGSRITMAEFCYSRAVLVREEEELAGAAGAHKEAFGLALRCLCLILILV